MEFITTVTQKGQVTIPKIIRDKVNIKPKDVVKVEASKGGVTLKKVETILDIAGTFVPRKNKDKSPEEAREYMETNYERT